MENKEEWKKVNVDASQDYEVSTLGRVRNAKTGNLIGSKWKDGYIHVTANIGGRLKSIRVHQWVWSAFGEGEPNKGMVIDHINNNKSDNRLANLQLISFRENTHKEIATKSGVVGVHWSKQKERWRAMISLDNVRYSLGYCKTVEEAQALYDEALGRYQRKGITPDDLKERLPKNKKRCTMCKEVLDVSEYDDYITCRGNESKRAKCKECHKTYRSVHDKKYRIKLKNTQ